MNIVLLGANGQTGRLLTRRALDEGHHVVAITRRPESFPLRHARLLAVEADVREPGSLNANLEGTDAVISTLGVEFTRAPVDTYSAGTANTIQAMRAAHVRRLVVVSSTGAYPKTPRRDVPLSLRIFEPIITHTIGKTVYDDIRRMESIVRDSNLDWTIVRPSGLFDLPQSTNYTAGGVNPIGAFTARIDLADYLVAMVADPATIASTVTVSTTEHTPTLWQVIQREAFKKPASAPATPT